MYLVTKVITQNYRGKPTITLILLGQIFMKLDVIILLKKKILALLNLTLI